MAKYITVDGFEWEIVDKKGAIAAFNASIDVFVLHDDGSETLLDLDGIKGCDGVLGIEVGYVK